MHYFFPGSEERTKEAITVIVLHLLFILFSWHFKTKQSITYKLNKPIDKER